MIPEDVLERGLAAAAESFDVPPGAVDRLREQIAPMQKERHRITLHGHGRGAGLLMAAAVIVLLVVLPFALGGGGGSESAITAPAASTVPTTVGGSAGGSSGSGFDSVHTTSGSKAARGPVAGPVPPNAGVPGSSGTTTGGGATTTVGGSGSVAAVPPGTTDTVTPPLPIVQSRVIKTGEMDLQVPKGNVGPTLDRLTGIATLERGYISNSRTTEGGEAPSGEVTIRVPVERFEDAISRARHIPDVKVLALDTSGQDVTSKFVDTQARIKALQATRATFLTLLGKATTIGETLVVQQHVNDVQTQIEQLQGQLKVLADRSSFSTLTVTVDQKIQEAVAKKPHEKSGLHKAFDRSVSRFARGFDAIVAAIGPLLLALLIAATFVLVGVFGYRLLRRRLV